MTLVDTNVIADLLGNDPNWYDWSLLRLAESSLKGPLLINEVVFAELSVRLQNVEEVEDLLEEFALSFSPSPRLALFLAGKAFARYRQRGGARATVLPDFFLGAHAAAIDAPVLTRDPRHFRGYFPTVRLITP